MRSVVRAVVLGGCTLVLSVGFLHKNRVAAGTVAGEVTAISADAVTLAESPPSGRFSISLLRGARRFPIAPVLATQIHAGDRISADLMPDSQGDISIGKIRFLHRAATKPDVNDGTLALGSVLPARTALGIDAPFSVGAGQGTPTVLAFLYTSCGMPAACPLLTQKLQELQGQIRGRGRIVTLSLDPEVDTLATLRSFAEARKVDRDTWKIGRLELADLEPLLRQVGVARVRSGDQLVHSTHLLLLDGDGRITWRSDGNSWEPAALAERLRALSPKNGGSV